MRRHARASSAATVGGSGSSARTRLFDRASATHCVNGNCAPSAGRARLTLVALAAAALAILAFAPLASAAPKGVVGVFGQEGSADGEFLVAGGVAVNQTTGDVYVVDVGNNRVERFDANGSFLSQFGSSGSGDGEFAFNGETAGIAVAPDGSVYVADVGNNRIQKFDAAGNFVSTFGLDVDPGNPGAAVCTTGCQAGSAGTGAGEFTSPIGVGIDPSNGDVLVADRDNNRIQRFSAAGAYQSQFDGPDGDPLFGPARVAVDSTGAIYVLEPGTPRLQKFDSAGENPAAFASDTLTNSPQEIALDPATDNVLVAQYDASFSSVDVLDFSSDGAGHETYSTQSSFMTGLAVRSDSGRIYASDGFASRALILDAPRHSVTVAPATDIEAHGATLNGQVDPGGAPASYHFEVSADSGVSWTSFPSPDADAGGGSGNVPVSQPATGLEANKAYRVRLVAANEFGFAVTSTETTFTTDAVAPDATTLGATQLRSTSAFLQGAVNPNNLPTTYHFEYGETTAYGTSLPVPSASAGSGAEVLTVAEPLTGLQPNTTYHFRLVATSVPAGTTEGGDRTFTTRAAVGPPAGRGYELVSPAYKPGGVGIGKWDSGLTPSGWVGYGAHEGERFALQGALGSVINDAPFMFSHDWAFAERTPSGWVHRPGISRRAYGSQLFADVSLSDATPDLSLHIFASAHLLRMFPEMESWPAAAAMFVHQWTGGWELFGYLDPAQLGVYPHNGGQGLWESPRALAADGSAIVASASGDTRGLAGPGDPAGPTWPDLVCIPPAEGFVEVCPSNVYLDEIRGPFSDTFPGDDGIRQLVNVCTSGTKLPARVDLGGGVFKQGAVPCSDKLPGRDARLISPRGAAIALGHNGRDTGDVISADGSRVFFMSPSPSGSDYQGPTRNPCEGIGQDSACPTQLFVRQRNEDGKVVTRWISQTAVTQANGALADQDASLMGPAYFEGASRDGDKVFFRTNSPLTADDPNGGAPTPGGVTAGDADSQSWDLYMYDLPDGPDGDPTTPDGDPAGGELTRISSGPDGDGDCNVGERQGVLRFSSDDGVRAYFTCHAPLPGVAPAQDGTITSAGGTPSSLDSLNFYAYDGARSEEQWRFIARLPTGDGVGQSPLAGCATLGTGQGASLIVDQFGGVDLDNNNLNNCVHGTSDGALVTFFTVGRLTGDDPDAVSGDLYGYDATRDELTRLSAPQGVAAGAYPCLPGGAGQPPSNTLCYGDGGMGQGFVPLARLGVAGAPGGDRAAFFESRSRLVPEDHNDVYDVYEWSDGELSLISPGAADSDGVYFAGNERSGRNVYLSTRDRLTWQDVDAVFDVYTARVDGGFPEPPSPPACAVLTDACQGAVSVPPVSPKASTNALTGSGNVIEPKKCVKGKVRKKGKCVKKKSQRAKHANRGTGK